MVASVLTMVLVFGVQALSLLILARIVVSFVPDFRRGHPLVDVLEMLTNPILAPFRRLSMGGGGGAIDFSPVFALVTIKFVVITVLLKYVKLLPF